MRELYEQASADIEKTFLEYDLAQVDAYIYAYKIKMEAYILQWKQRVYEYRVKEAADRLFHR